MQHTKWGFVIFFNINDNRQIAAVTQLRDNGVISYYRVLLEPGIVHSTPTSRAHIYWPIRIQADGERAEILMPHLEYQVRHKLNLPFLAISILQSTQNMNAAEHKNR